MTAQQAIDTAFASGKRAGRAMREHDQSRCTCEREWFQRFRNLWKTLQGYIGSSSGPAGTWYGPTVSASGLVVRAGSVTRLNPDSQQVQT